MSSCFLPTFIEYTAEPWKSISSSSDCILVNSRSTRNFLAGSINYDTTDNLVLYTPAHLPNSIPSAQEYPQMATRTSEAQIGVRIGGWRYSHLCISYLGDGWFHVEMVDLGSDHRDFSYPVENGLVLRCQVGWRGFALLNQRNYRRAVKEEKNSQVSWCIVENCNMLDRKSKVEVRGESNEGAVFHVNPSYTHAPNLDSLHISPFLLCRVV